MCEEVVRYAREHRPHYLESLMAWLRIPSVSTLPEHEPDIRRAAGWLRDYLVELEPTRLEVMETAGYPVVYGEWTGPEGAPTLLAYGHYDVQPVDPLEAWRTPPFEPTVEGDSLFCRGASDDKGQLFTILAALEAHLRVNGRLPINLKLLVEGEEEVINPHLAEFVRQQAELLAADAVLICDQAILDPNTPLIMYGMRGNVLLEVEVRGPAQDLHSGTFGGAVDNPFNVLARLLARVQDGETRRIAIPGFYDRVRPLDEGERALIAQLPITEQVAQFLAGVPAVAGEEGYTAAEWVSVRPTFEIHGMPGGFTGEGSKTVIPARAMAKVSMRLVPDQDPREIARLFEAYLRTMTPPTVELEVRVLGMAWPVVVDYQAPEVQAAAAAYEAGFGAPALYMRGGGSLPVVWDFQEVLGVPVVMMGCGLPDDNTHAPNERLHLPTFYRGIEAVAHYFSRFAEVER